MAAETPPPLHTDIIPVILAVIPFAVAALFVQSLRRRMERLAERNIVSKPMAERVVSFAALIAYTVAALTAAFILTGLHEALYAAIIASALAALPAIQLLYNMYAYYIISTERIVAPGERINIAGYTGTVYSVSLFTTTLRTKTGEQVILPNKLLLENIIAKEPMDRTVVELEVVLHGIRSRDPQQTMKNLEEVATRLRKILAEYKGAIKSLETRVTLESLEGDKAVFKLSFYVVAAGSKMLSGLVSAILSSLAEYSPDIRIKRQV